MSNKHILSKNYLDITNKDNVRYLDDQNISFRKYLESIRGYKRLDYNEEITIINKYQSKLINEGDLELSKLIGSHQRYIVSLAKRYCTKDIDILDLISEGNYGLLKAMQTYNCDYDVKFLTYASSYVLKYMFEFLHVNKLVQQQNRGKISTSVVQKITEEFFQENGYYPNSRELREEFAYKGISVKYSDDFDEITIDSLDEYSDEDDECYMEYGEDDATINSNINNEYYQKLIGKLFQSLTADEQQIITWKFGLDGNGERNNNYIAHNLHISVFKVNVQYLNILKKLQTVGSKLENKL